MKTVPDKDKHHDDKNHEQGERFDPQHHASGNFHVAPGNPHGNSRNDQRESRPGKAMPQ